MASTAGVPRVVFCVWSKGEAKLLPVAGAVVLPGAEDDWNGGVAAGVWAKREKLGLESCAGACRGVP